MGFIDTVKDRPAIIYAAPLCGMMAGATAGRLLCSLELPARLLRETGGPFLGPIIADGGNLAVAGGLAGLVVSMALVSWWAKKNKPQINTDQHR